jgi:hypothetical protein
MNSPEDRIADLERQLSELQRTLAGVACRPAIQPPQLRGWWLAVLTSALGYNSSASAEILQWSNGAWKRTGKTITVQSFWLNSDDAAVDACTLIKVEWYDNVWVPTAIYCKKNNWLQGCTTP